MKRWSSACPRHPSRRSSPPAVGEQLILRSPDGNELPALIVDVDDEEATLDANHPLAGFALTFEIELISVG
jgi:FKBP-type peptidyl-prolyl cis-trans isomerases 2